jgi:hypothetical protein
MKYLRNMLLIPVQYDLADAQPDRQLLSVELFRDMEESRKISGTTDVAIAKSEHVRNDAVRNNIEALIELKTPKNMKKQDHSPQTIGEHFAASYLNPKHAVVSVLTDLNTKWIFFWFAAGEDDSEMSLFKLVLEGDEAAADAKYLLDSLHGNPVKTDTLPTTFEKRQPLQAVLDCLLKRKRAKIELVGDNGHSPNQDPKPSSSRGSEHHLGSSAHVSSTGNLTSGQQSNQSGAGSGSSSISMANALSLFAPPGDRDVANELDLLDMDTSEQSKIISSFAAEHIVPYMKG